MNKHTEKSKDWVWWKHGIIYQIYPRSFMDSNNDGIGDIRGIIDKIDYLVDLGVDAIWLSPINKSPMVDFGYDISDYRKIDPVFGTNDDFLKLIKSAHKLGIKIIMDLVINHTSDQHPWFLESRSSRGNPKRDWYIWHDGKKGKPPNNWISALGKSAWVWDKHTESYYMHSFFPEQPDVNWRNPELKKAMFNEIRYWLDKGVDGFRLDVVNWLFKDKHLRNNRWTLNPINPLRYKYMRNRPEVHEFLKEFRSLLDEYDKRMSVGEVFSFPPGDPALSARFLGKGDDELHLVFDFSLLYTKWDAYLFYRSIRRWLSRIPEKGWPCHVLSNHDQPRSFSRLGGKYADKRAFVAAAFLLTLPGTPFIYYGEEIGMVNGIIARKEITDPLGKKFWPFYKGRDKARTPMQWNSKINAGFSTATPWLPVNSDYNKVNLDSQKKDGYSLFHFYRSLIKLRKEIPALCKGEWDVLIKGRNGVLCYKRKYLNDICIIVLNFTAKEKQVKIDLRGQWKVIISTHKSLNCHYTNLEFNVAPNEATILKLIGNLDNQ